MKSLERVRLEISRKARQYASMRDDDLREKNYLHAAALDRMSDGLRLAAEIVKEEIQRLEKCKRQTD